MKKKICFVIYNRSNYARLKPILEKINRSKNFKLQIILTSSSVLVKYGDLGEIIKKDGFKVNYAFFSHIEGENNLTMTKSVSIIIHELSTAFQVLNPDIVVTIGDRYETMATGICSSFLNIYLVHIQGGELTSSIDEKVRHSITKLSNLHFVCTKQAKNIVTQMGEEENRVINVGCTSIDLIKKINFKNYVNLAKYKYGVGNKINLKKKYIVVLIHPNTLNYNKNLELVSNTFDAIQKIDEQTIWIWPNIDAGADLISHFLRSKRESNPKLKINFYKNFEPDDYLKIIYNSQCLIGNTSSGIRECSYLSVPFVNIGDRQDRREKGNNVFDTPINNVKIIRNIKLAIKSRNKIKKSKIYGDGNSSSRIVKILKKINTNIDKKFIISKK